MMRLRYILPVVVIISLLYGLVLANKIDAPTSSLDWWNLSAAESIVSGGKPFIADPRFDRIALLLEHPIFYLYLVALVLKIFGIGIIQARVVGIAFFLFTFYSHWCLYIYFADLSTLTMNLLRYSRCFFTVCTP